MTALRDCKKWEDINKMARTETKNQKKRRLDNPEYKSFRLSKRISHPSNVRLPSSWSLLRTTFQILKNNWKYFGLMTLIYGLLMLVFVRSSSKPVDIVELKDTFNTLLGQSGGAASTVSLFGILVGSSGLSSDIAGTYQLILILVFSLATVFGLRHIFSSSSTKPGVKDSLYQGMTPIIPFILVLLVVGLQLLPLSIGTSLYSTVIASGIAVTALEKVLWLIMLILLCVLTFYMISSSIFALYIVMLPKMTPMKALRSARDLVKHRRWTVMRKLVALPIFLLALVAIIVMPMIAFTPRYAELIFFTLTLLLLPLFHTYMYTLYRKLL